MRKFMIAACAAVTLTVVLAGCSSSSGDDATASDCTPAHEVETVQAGKLTVAVPVSPPYSIKDGDRYTGLDNDILAQIAELECLEIEYQEMSFSAGLQSVQSGRVDTATGGVGKTEERGESLNQGYTTYRDGMALVSEEGYSTYEDLESLTLGVVQGYFWNDDLIAAFGIDRVKQYQNSDAMFADLEAGRIDVAVASTSEAGYRLTQAPDSGLVVELMEPHESIAGSLGFGEVGFPNQKGSALTAAFDEDVQTLLESGAIADVLASYKIDGAMAGPAPE